MLLPMIEPTTTAVALQVPKSPASRVSLELAFGGVTIEESRKEAQRE
jgi:hypothetical protein